ncbi:T9SS type A sorting domain-containing protein [Owenweeksia hongkongensis]|uniref:T9SS type A sorting domain-containing protein n=1 Tax=Owenweeksia hongkongensis TaxID=253245 RepID=UPI003A92D628
MLRKLLFAITALLSFNSYSQCIADAGPDQHWCGHGSTDTISLGGTPTGNNGQAPYTYQWSMDAFTIGSTTFDASVFLNDTTLANPKLVSAWDSEMTFYLKVADAQNVVCYDTVTITASSFDSHLGSNSFSINQGDSVQLFDPNIISTLPVDSILWRPNHGLIDSNATRPWVKPTHDIVYYCIVWDTAGCSQQGAPFQFVTVNHLGNSEFEESQIDIYPTLLKVEESLNIDLPQNLSNARVEIRDLTGRSVFSASLENEKSEFALSSLPKGIYVCSINTKGKIITQKKIVLE